ncbi:MULTISPECIES: hypothetical protein [unclassified Bartonella]|uniref:hypothetical protein n=1 Tax=unclassified Bartonella TaxID=2645622 RepID=UPI0035D12CCA
MIKLLSKTYVIISITFFSVFILLGCTKVRNLAEYDRLYEKYVHENYTRLEYSQKLEKAKKEVEYLKAYMEKTVDIPHDKSQFWKYLITLPRNPPEFNILRHYHILLVFCGRFFDLWQGDKTMPTLTFNDLPTRLKDFKANGMKYRKDWDYIENIFFQAKFETNFDDPMFAYAEKFLDSPNGISRKEQTLQTEQLIIGNELTRFRNTATMCVMAREVYLKMMPKEDVKPPVRYSTFEKWKQYLKNL